MKLLKRINPSIPFFLGVIFLFIACEPKSQSNWELANENKDLLKVSTIFTAPNDVRYKLATESGLDSAVNWCKESGVTRVFIESFRGYTAEREVLENAKKRFEAEGIEASGCVTTVNFGKQTTGWELIACYTNEQTRKELKEIFEYTASIFDVIMIDDFLFTDCECEECLEACGDQDIYQYRCDMMNMISREYIQKPARAVNPNVRIINKFPQWYDRFHERGYEVKGEIESYEITWVGTETRDNDFVNDTEGLNLPQYGAYYIMRWLKDLGKEKTEGGWFDALGTTEKTYVEQARQTVLADATELMLFSYGGLIRETNTYGNRTGTGIANTEAFRKELPGLFELAKLIDGKPIKGILATKPPNSSPKIFYDSAGVKISKSEETYMYNFLGMLGLPLVPKGQIDMNANAAFFPIHIIKDPEYQNKIESFIQDGKPVLITDGLASQIQDIDMHENVQVLQVNGNPRDVLRLGRDELNEMRKPLLKPFGISFDAPAMVSLYLMGDDLIVIENFKDEAVNVILETEFSMDPDIQLTLPADAQIGGDLNTNKLEISELPPRTLVAIGI